MYTKQGNVKYQTDCSPTNGYYLIPLEDKGYFKLEVDPPVGWSFQPRSVVINVDGVNDACSKGEDINFEFTGFTLTGKVVSKSLLEGPAGVGVKLISGETVISQTTTKEFGQFSFAKVTPGNYTIQSSHLSIKFDKNRHSVLVTDDNLDIGPSLVISGYDVTGYVINEDQPIAGVQFLLFTDTVKHRATGCEPIMPAHYKEESKGFVCFSTSDQDGRFSFGDVVPGSYIVRPHFKTADSKFDVGPTDLTFNVGHESLVLSPKFNVLGFSMTGRVVTHIKGAGIGGVQVIVNGRPAAITDVNGQITLEGIKPKEYKISFISDGIIFDDLTIRATANKPNLGEIIPNFFHACGAVNVDDITLLPLNVEVLNLDTKQRLIIATNRNGLFCAELPRGEHEIRVVTTDLSPSVHFVPEPIRVLVFDKPLSELSFKQFKTNITGTLKMLTAVPSGLKIELRSEMADTLFASVLKTADFRFDGVFPGTYEATIIGGNYCWEAVAQTVVITSKSRPPTISFKQTGFKLVVTTSHSISMFQKYTNPASPTPTNSTTEEIAETELTITSGRNEFCLIRPGVYQFRTIGCHKFAGEPFIYDTAKAASLTAISLTATEHLVSASVTSKVLVKDIMVAVKMDNGQQLTLGPLLSNKDVASDSYSYPFTVWTRPQSTLEFTPNSATLLFYPATIEVTVDDDCVQDAAEFVGRKGVYVTGVVKPALEGVAITLTVEDSSGKRQIDIKTDKNGGYRTGPFHYNSKYSVQADKVGYVLTPVEGTDGDFTARRLAGVTVEVITEDGQPLKGTLLSFSGGNNYRHNALSNDEGIFLFTSLKPGEYYLRAMMKEFSFRPSSSVITVNEGASVTTKVTAVRVAFSCMGRVLTLTGEPIEAIELVAVGVTEPCMGYEEQGITAADGSYRVRGLQPGCSYNLKLKANSELIDRLLPPERVVQMLAGDATGVDFVGLKFPAITDLLLTIDTKPEFLSSLKVKLIRLSDEKVLVSDSNVDTLVPLPSVPSDRASYLVKLESTLSRNVYQYQLPEITIIASAPYQSVQLAFHPALRSFDSDGSPGSAGLGLTFLAILLSIGYWKYGTEIKRIVTRFIAERASIIVHHSPAASADVEPDTDLLGDILGDSGATSNQQRKKTKARKT